METELICNEFRDHIFTETYYGYKCDRCGQFYAYGNAPWDPYCSACGAMFEEECCCNENEPDYFEKGY